MTNPRILGPRRGLALAAAGLAASATAAHATWSIILIDVRTGEIAAGSATCLTGFDLQANTPVLLTGIGACTAQSFVDSTGQNRVFVRDKLALGMAPQDIITALATFDTGHQTRQYGIADIKGRTATFSGSGASAWAGGQTGQFLNTYAGQTGNIAYAIQGNILTGPCVVQAAVVAAINEPGDLPQKLMKSMQAARVTGGDGRCSCPGNPTGCGCPPTTFTKSAHIAYMLIARAGDQDGYWGVYRANASPLALAARDITGDGRPELFAANSVASVSVLPNITTPGNPFAMFALPVSYTTGNQPRDLEVVDMNADGLADIVTPNFSGNTVSVLLGQPGGTFGPKSDYLAGGTPGALAVADFNGAGGPDVVVTNQNFDLVTVMLNNGAGAVATRGQFGAGVEPRGIVAVNFDAGPTKDLVICSRNQSKLTVLLGNGDGTFSPAPDIATPPMPTFVVSGDFDGDSDPDFAVGTQGAPVGITILLNNGGSFASASHTLPIQPGGLAAGDVTGDGRPDLIAGLGTQRFAILQGSATGAFTNIGTPLTGFPLSETIIADLNADGDQDAAFTGGSAIIADNFGGGTFSDGIGTGSGDYFMTFNVPNPTAGNPDPVATLQIMFDTWRTAHTGRPDAVQSLTSMTPAVVPANPTEEATLSFTLRDWQGQPVTQPMVSVQVTHAPGSAGSSTILPLNILGNGQYSVDLHASTTVGTDLFQIRVDDGVRPVILMPFPRLRVGVCYPDCTGDGLLAVSDFGCFQTKFVQGDLYADCTGEGLLSAADFGCFQTRFVTGCP